MADTPVPQDLTLNVRGDVKVVVPNNVWLLTPYVLLEQEDWFEDEIGFVREYLVKGMRVLDLGANYGLYTLAAARVVGPGGAVWAFEPSDQAARYLSRSMAANAFDNVHLIRAGVSSSCRTAYIPGGEMTETHVVVHDENPGDDYVPIELLTLDKCAEKFAWDDFDFMKMDVEGEELNVVEGGEKFFEQFSPLIMFEFRREGSFNVPLLEKLQGLGYSTFRLVPGLGVLAPYGGEDDLDRSCLNLFCARPERIAKLQERSLAITEPAGPVQATDDSAWRGYLAGFPYGKASMPTWLQEPTPERSDPRYAYREVLSSYALAQDRTRDVQQRYAHLRQAYDAISRLAREAPSPARLATFVRIAGDMGMRSLTLGPLAALAKHLRQGRSLSLDEPFLCVSPDFDDIDPEGRLEHWFRAAVLHQWEKSRSYSSYFLDSPEDLELLEEIKRVGFQRPEMERRRLLWMHCYGRSGDEIPPVLTRHSRDNLNPGIWSDRLLMTREAVVRMRS